MVEIRPLRNAPENLTCTDEVKEEEEDDFDEDRIDQLLGERICILIRIKNARGIPPKLTKDTYVNFQFFLDAKPTKTPPSSIKSINPRWDFAYPVTLVSCDIDSLLYDRVFFFFYRLLFLFLLLYFLVSC